jgi:hypothetical protein
MEIKQTASALRYNMVECFITALSHSATGRNIKSGFAASGILPLDQSHPLANDLLPPEYGNIQIDNVRRDNGLNSTLLTIPSSIANLYRSNAIADRVGGGQPTIVDITTQLNKATKSSGLPISPLPDLIAENDQKISRIKWL